MNLAVVVFVIVVIIVVVVVVPIVVATLLSVGMRLSSDRVSVGCGACGRDPVALDGAVAFGARAAEVDSSREKLGVGRLREHAPALEHDARVAAREVLQLVRDDHDRLASAAHELALDEPAPEVPPDVRVDGRERVVEQINVRVGV